MSNKLQGDHTAESSIRKFLISRLPKSIKRILMSYGAQRSITKKPNEIYMYCGYQLPYRASPATIRVLESGQYWEDKLTKTMIQVLSNLDTPQPLVLDIGANVGLVTLGIVAASPSVNVCAFEPAPFQRTLLQKTISANKLGDRVHVFDIAFGVEKSKASFAAHFGIDASGLDGFFDTGVGGLANQITVNVDKLDNWWIANGSPKVDIIKLDTEGSELWILQGANQLLQTCKPTLFIEISSKWLKHYSCSPQDVFVWLKDNGYCLYTLEGKRVTVSQLVRLMDECNSDNFMGQPIID